MRFQTLFRAPLPSVIFAAPQLIIPVFLRNLVSAIA